MEGWQSCCTDSIWVFKFFESRWLTFRPLTVFQVCRGLQPTGTAALIFDRDDSAGPVETFENGTGGAGMTLLTGHMLLPLPTRCWVPFSPKVTVFTLQYLSRVQCKAIFAKNERKINFPIIWPEIHIFFISFLHRTGNKLWCAWCF